MHRFWLGTVAAGLAFLFAWGVFFKTFPMRIYRHDYAIWAAKFELLKERPAVAPDVVILGDSGSISGLPVTKLKASAINLGLPCGGPIEASYFYDRYRRAHAPPKVLVIQFTQYFYHGVECLPQYALSFDFFSFKEKAAILREFENASAELPLFDGFAKVDAVRRWLYLGLGLFHLNPQQILAVRSMKIERGTHKPEEDFEKTIEQRGHFVFGLEPRWDKLRTHYFEFDEFRPHPVIVSHLHRLIRTAREDGSKVLVRVTPLNPATVRNFSETHRKQFAEFLSGLANEYPGLVAETSIREWPPEAFGDEDIHMNAHGAELEGEHLARELEKEMGR